ncbi:MAG TPA: hypothetical protein VGD84_01205, partial [Pseudonocardiaceae bacterium]
MRNRRVVAWSLSVLGVGLAASVVVAQSALALTAAGDPCGRSGVLNGTTCTYDTVGSDTFTVPAGATSVEVFVTGAQGGRYFLAGDAAHGGSPVGDITGRAGGGGGQASGTLAGLGSGQVLQVDVAGRGVDGTAASRSGGKNNGPSGGQGALGGFGGATSGVAGGRGDAGGADGGTGRINGGNGAGGGGSSDVRVAAGGCAALTCALPDRVLVGAGGGGGGGIGGQGNALGGGGGDGGGIAGAAGGATVDGGHPGTPGGGATQSAAGAGGLNAGRHAIPPPPDPSDPRFGGDGADGSAGVGGVGGVGNQPCIGVHTPPCRNPDDPTSGG